MCSTISVLMQGGLPRDVCIIINKMKRQMEFDDKIKRMEAQYSHIYLMKRMFHPNFSNIGYYTYDRLTAELLGIPIHWLEVMKVITNGTTPRRRVSLVDLNSWREEWLESCDYDTAPIIEYNRRYVRDKGGKYEKLFGRFYPNSDEYKNKVWEY